MIANKKNVKDDKEAADDYFTAEKKDWENTKKTDKNELKIGEIESKEKVV